MKRVAFVALLGQSEAVHVNQLAAPVDKTNVQLTHKDTQEGLATDEDIDDAMTSIQHLAEYEKKAGQKEADDQKREAEYKMIQKMEAEKQEKKKKEEQERNEKESKDAKVKAEKQKKVDEEKKAKEVVQAKERKAKEEKEAKEKKIRDEQEAKEKKARDEKEAAERKANEIRLAAEAKAKAERDAKIAVENKELNRMMAKAADKQTQEYKASIHETDAFLSQVTPSSKVAKNASNGTNSTNATKPAQLAKPALVVSKQQIEAEQK